MRYRLLAGVAAAAVAFPSIAAAQGGANTSNPFSPGLPSAPAPTPTATPPTTIAPITTTSSGGSLGGGAIVGIAVGALALLGGISFFIWHDARKRAPVRHAHADAGLAGRSGSKPRAKPRKLSTAERRRRKRGRAR